MNFFFLIYIPRSSLFPSLSPVKGAAIVRFHAVNWYQVSRWGTSLSAGSRHTPSPRHPRRVRVGNTGNYRREMGSNNGSTACLLTLSI